MVNANAAFVVLQASLQSEAVPANRAAAEQLSADKQSAEQAVIDLLKQAKSMTQQKVEMCERRYQQIDSLSCSTASAIMGGCPAQNSNQLSMSSVKETVKHNDAQLAACREVVLAFRATQDARIQLEQCMAKEQALLQQLQGPLQQSVTASKHLINGAAKRLKNSNPTREKRHAEMLIRLFTLCTS